MNHLGDFIDLNDTIRNYKSDVYLNKTTRIADPTRPLIFQLILKAKQNYLYC